MRMTTTAVAPTNIAILKYWGKEPGKEDLSIPTKSSISFTVSELETTTTLESGKKKGAAQELSLTLNGKGKPRGSSEHRYVESFFSTVSRFFPVVSRYDFRIISENNFPTAAGFASSASGFAALAKALSGEVPGLGKLDEKRLSAIARLGSGSAARSIPGQGGIVLWERGGSMWKSIARSLYPHDYWPDLRIIYATTEAGEKKVKSREGMQVSVSTNPIYSSWVRYEEKVLRGAMLRALAKKDFPALSELIMKASNSFHQICFGTYPMLRYLNESSFRIIEAIEEMNSSEMKAAYTFDAGPNAVIFTLSRNEQETIRALSGIAQEIRVTKPGKGARFSDKHLS
ncbi:MAG: diphosphomevalonate decarboxylase [Candidatus Micrarchaeota archaeon]